MRWRCRERLEDSTSYQAVLEIMLFRLGFVRYDVCFVEVLREEESQSWGEGVVTCPSSGVVAAVDRLLLSSLTWGNMRLVPYRVRHLCAWKSAWVPEICMQNNSELREIRKTEIAIFKVHGR